MARWNAEVELLFRRLGITFAVYGETNDVERLIPFDIVPSIFGAAEWQRLELGLKQRVRALNAFLHDIYHDQEIIKAGVISARQILDNVLYRPEMQGTPSRQVSKYRHHCVYLFHEPSIKTVR